MSVLAQDRLRSTSPQMTRLLTPYWTRVRAGRSRRSSPATPARIPRPAPPGSPPPATRWDQRGINTSRPSPSRWRRRRLTSRCWRSSRDSPSLSCHVTFTNTNQRGGRRAARGSLGRTRSCRTVRLFPPPAPLVVPS